MRAVQIAEKFLERPELASMSFQNDFLKPFVVVMRQSEAKEIRELIIRQASRMVLSQVHNVKSGWKSMFMVRPAPPPRPACAGAPCLWQRCIASTRMRDLTSRLSDLLVKSH